MPARSASSPTRTLVQDDVFGGVRRKVRRRRQVVQGSGNVCWIPIQDGLAPLNPRRVTSIQGCMVQVAVGKGAKLETGGKRVGNKGLLPWSRAVVSDVPKDARATNEEPFGPLGADLRFLVVR